MTAPAFPACRSLLTGELPVVLAAYVPQGTAQVQPTVMPWDAPLFELWQRPRDLTSRDRFTGPWSSDHAPDPDGEYMDGRRSAIHPNASRPSRERTPDRRRRPMTTAARGGDADAGPE